MTFIKKHITYSSVPKQCRFVSLDVIEKEVLWLNLSCFSQMMSKIHSSLYEKQLTMGSWKIYHWQPREKVSLLATTCYLHLTTTFKISFLASSDTFLFQAVQTQNWTIYSSVSSILDYFIVPYTGCNLTTTVYCRISSLVKYFQVAQMTWEFCF